MIADLLARRLWLSSNFRNWCKANTTYRWHGEGRLHLGRQGTNCEDLGP